MTTKTYSVSWMHCASCATLIQGEMKEISGITSCEINLIHHTATVDFTADELPLDQLNKKLQPFGYEFCLPTTIWPAHWTFWEGDMNSQNWEKSKSFCTAQKEMWISIPFIALSLFLMSRMLGAEYGVLGIQEMPEVFHYVATRRLLPLVATFVIFTIGRKYLRAVWTYVTYGKATMDTLVGIGTGFAYLYSMFITLFGIGLLFDIMQYVPVSGLQLALSAWLERFSWGISQYLDTSRVFYEAVIIVIGFISIGKYMEQRTMSKTGQAIKALLNLQVKKARKLVVDVENMSNKKIA